MKFVTFGTLVATTLTASSMAFGADNNRTQLNAGMDIKYDSNLFSRPNPTDSWIEVLRAGGKLVGRSGFTSYTFTANASTAFYNDSSADDYTDYGLGGSFGANPSARHGFTGSLNYKRSHDARGSDDTTIAPTPNRYAQTIAKGKYRFGAPTAQGRLELDVGYSDKEYKNNRTITSSLDYDDLMGGATFYWRVAPKTSALAQYRQTETDYDTANRDSTLREYLVGVTWEATAKTTGIVKIGQAKRDFDSAARADKDSSSWEATVKWEPQTYSTFDLTTAKKIDNATAAGDDSITNTNWRLDWNHRWSTFWSTRASASYTEADYSNASGRNDETTSLGVKANYAFTRDLTLGIGYTYTERDSNFDVNDYDRDTVLLSVDWQTK